MFKNACRTCNKIILVLLTNNITAQFLALSLPEQPSFLKAPANE